MSIKKGFLAGLFISVFVLTGCDFFVKQNGGGNSVSYPHHSVLNTPDGEKGSSDTSEDVNPTVSESRSESLDFIFSTESLGKTTITIDRLEWNQLLRNFDYFYKNENLVLAANYTYEKDGMVWSLNEVGLRLRGNTSRFRPQGKDYPNDQSGNHKMNDDWSKDYYFYAASCSDNDYRQSHFKVDFEPREDDDRKLSNCMKGVALKRMDGSATREIFCYDLFHRYGIWTAPRASHTKVIIKFIEEDGSETTVDYGVYEMFEEVNKQSLKARDKDENKESNAWKNSKGSLWKCAGGDLSNPNVKYGVENIRITEFDENDDPVSYVWDAPTYDLKADKGNLVAASAEFRTFITELNALPKVSNINDTEAIEAIKGFYEKWMDVDFFLKTYAVNILVGMDDDYWGNANNYYLYFTDTPGNGRKVYLIPFDYDNTLGASIAGDKKKGTPEGIEQNPLEWGRGANRPLMDKLLQVPEYRARFRELLLEVSAEDSEWTLEKGSQRFLNWKSMVEGSLWSPNLNSFNSCLGWWDGGWHPGGYYLTHEPSLYDYTRYQFRLNLGDHNLTEITFDLNGGNIDGDTSALIVPYPGSPMDIEKLCPATPVKEGYVFRGWTKTLDGNDFEKLCYLEKLYARWEKLEDITDLFIVEVKDPSYEGFKIKILNPPTYYNNKTNTGGAQVRQIFVDGVKVADDSGEWAFPYTETGKTYSVYVKYLNGDWWSEHSSTNTLSVKASSGLGKFSLENGPLKVKVVNNKLSFEEQPVIYVAGQKITPDYAPGKFYVGFHDSSWYVNNENKFEYVSEIPEFNVFDFLQTQGKSDFAAGKQLEATARFKVYGTDWGEYKLDIPLTNNSFVLKGK